MPDSATDALERFLLGDDGAASSDLLEAAGLAAYAHTRRPEVAAFKRVFVSASLRHAALRSEVQRLVAAWLEAGIDCLLFKGFYLAEFVYERPGERLYSDVDILMSAEDGAEASTIAQRLGWLELWHADEDDDLYSLRDARYQGHEILQLVHPKLGVQLDVHRRIVHNNHNRLPYVRRQERITQEAWRSAEEAAWGETRVQVLHPLDSLLVGLVLNRSWSSDDWALRPHDYLDFRALVRRCGISRARLEARSRELGCPRTLELFLARCNPFEERLELKRPSSATKQLWNLRVTPERGHRYAERWLTNALALPGHAWDLATAFPLALHALKLVEADSPAEVVPLLKPEPRALSSRQWRGLKKGVHRSLRLLCQDEAMRREATALALYTGLRAQGYPAQLFASDEPRVYWLELHGRPLNLGGTSLGKRD